MRQFLQRFMYWNPCKVTEPWKPGIQLGCDEFHNPSIMVKVPLLGCFTFFYNRRFQRDREHVWGCEGNVAYGFIDQDCVQCLVTLGLFVMNDFVVDETDNS